MNNQFMGNQIQNTEEMQIREIGPILQGFYDSAKNDHQQVLIILINSLQKILIKNFNENLPKVGPKDYNLSSAIYEKCLKIKEKNEELKIIVLNIQESLSKQMSHSKQSTKDERTYTETVDSIRRKGSDVRAKISKYRGTNTRSARLTNEDLLKSKAIVEVKKGTEYLQKKTLEMRR